MRTSAVLKDGRRPSVQHQGAAAEANHNMFANADVLKNGVHQNIDQPDWDITHLYKDDGCAQYIARSTLFSHMTLAVITLNAFWIGVDAELNQKGNLRDAQWYFQAGEHFFCVYFAVECVLRFNAFRKLSSCFEDRWFCFDGLLAVLAVFETYIVPYVLAPSGGGSSGFGNVSMLRMLRLLRLTRLVRLMRAVPELVTLLRSMIIALRSVLSTLLLLFIFTYVFAIIFKSQLPRGIPDELRKRFGRLPLAMWTLMLDGAFLDSPATCAKLLMDVSPSLSLLFIVFVFFAAYIIVSMLVGLLLEVVNAITEVEKEKVLVSRVKCKLLDVLHDIDQDGNGTISKDEFCQVIEKPLAKQALVELGVDVPNLVSLSDHLFDSNDVCEVKPDDSDCIQASVDAAENSITFADFLEMVIRLRSANEPSVLDIVDLRKLMLRSQRTAVQRLELLDVTNTQLCSELQLVCESVQRFCKGGQAAALAQWCAPFLGPAEKDRNSPALVTLNGCNGLRKLTRSRVKSAKSVECDSARVDWNWPIRL